MNFNIIVAMCKYNRGIGLNNTLPWNIKEDMQYFSKMTKGDGNNAVIMGSNTYSSLNKKGLPGRDNFILSSTLDLDFTIGESISKTHIIKPDLEYSKNVKNGYVNIVKSFKSIEKIIETCYANNYNTVWVIGGASIYKQFLDKNIIDKCYVTLIYKLFECDTFFPSLLDVDKWIIEKETDFNLDKKYEFKIKCVEYCNRG